MATTIRGQMMSSIDKIKGVIRKIVHTQRNEEEEEEEDDDPIVVVVVIIIIH